MKRPATLLLCLLALALPGATPPPPGGTVVSVVGDEFYINGQPTYPGRDWHGHKVQGLLLNARLVQGLFDDRNPNTVSRWTYPDTGRWDPERNTREFIAAMPDWRRQGLLAFTINLQGGMPAPDSAGLQPWHNSAYEADGSLRADYMSRLERVLNQADQLGLVVILGCFYFGQDHRLQNETAVLSATDHVVQWLGDHGWRNVLVEIDNECDMSYSNAILKPPRVAELIQRVQRAGRDGRRFLAGASFAGGRIPNQSVVRAADFILLHGNGVADPEKIADMVRRTRATPGFSSKPVLFNEDDHYDFDQPASNFAAAIGEHASWGYYDQGKNDYTNGYQSPPVNWGINTDRKKAFFRLVREITGTPPPPGERP
jgi:hypothetical protein